MHHKHQASYHPVYYSLSRKEDVLLTLCINNIKLHLGYQLLPYLRYMYMSFYQPYLSACFPLHFSRHNFKNYVRGRLRLDPCFQATT